MVEDLPPVLDRAVFDDFAQLFDAPELREVLEQWHADSQAALDVIDAALRRGELAVVGQMAHRAAGGGLALGATALWAACERLRVRAESDGSVVEDDIEPVREAVAATYRAVAEAAGF